MPRSHIHERAAIPKHIEILPELPKTAVGKIFKPDLRKLAITRVYNEALEGTGATVGAVREDKKRGLVAYLHARAGNGRGRGQVAAWAVHLSLGLAVRAGAAARDPRSCSFSARSRPMKAP